MPVVPVTQEAEVKGLFETAVSYDRTTAFQPGWQRKTLSPKGRVGGWVRNNSVWYWAVDKWLCIC